MRTRILSAVVGVTLSLAAAAPAHAATLFGLADNGSGQGLLPFDSGSPGSPSPFMPFTGIQSGELVQGIDFNPTNGALYAIGKSNTSNTLYTVNPATAAATIIGPISVPLSGNSFGMDFDPSGQLRVVSDADQNLVINPANGMATAGNPLMYMGGSPNPFISGLASSNGTFFGIDSNTNYLVIVDPVTGTVINRGFLGVAPGPLLGMDDVDDILFFVAGNHLHMVNKSTGNAPSLGDLPMNFLVTGLTGMSSTGGTPGGGTPGGGTPGGGTPGGNLPGDFNLDGAVDATDFVIFRQAVISGRTGATLPVRAPDGLGQGDEVDYQSWRMNIGRTAGGGSAGASQRRAVVLVKARKSVTLGAGERKRVRLPLTKAGKRFIRHYTKKRLKVTLRFTVRHRPAAGATEQRTFQRRVTLRVKRTRR